MSRKSFGSSARARPTRTNGGSMKKAGGGDADMRDHYDFRSGVRGKYAARYAEGTNVVVLDPDVAEMFPDRKLINETLRAVGRVVQLRERHQAGPNRRLQPTRKKRAR